MKANHFNAVALLLLLSLASFRPWKAVNRAFGLRDLSAQLDTLAARGDTMLIQQPIQVVITPVQVDSLAKLSQAKQDTLSALTEEGKDLDKKIAVRRKSNKKKQGQLVDEDQIQEILDKQTKQAKSKPAKDFDPDEESELEKEANKTPRPGMARLGSGGPK